jgi:hypothetical protein
MFAQYTGVRIVLWTCFWLPGTIAGIMGIIDAFRGKRKLALLWGFIAGLQGVPLCVCIGLAGVTGRTQPQEFGSLIALGLGLLPAAAAFWAVLLAFLIPPKPRRPHEPGSASLSDGHET